MLTGGPSRSAELGRCCCRRRAPLGIGLSGDTWQRAQNTGVLYALRESPIAIDPACNAPRGQLRHSCNALRSSSTKQRTTRQPEGGQVGFIGKPLRVDMGCLGGGASGDKVQQQKNKEIERQIDKERQRYKATHRLLLLGRCSCHAGALFYSSQPTSVRIPVANRPCLTKSLQIALFHC